MEVLPLEIWDLIFDRLAFVEQIRLRLTCKYFYDNLQITVLKTKYLKSNKKEFIPDIYPILIEMMKMNFVLKIYH